MAIVYENVFYDFVLVPLKAIFDEEFSYGKIYIAPEILYKDPFSIRIWGNNGESVEYLNDAWQKQYNIEIFLYSIEKNPQENFYKQFYNDIERIYQLLFENALFKSTAVTGSGSNVGEKEHKWIDGSCEEHIINDFEEGEEEIDGLNVCKFIFNCKITR